MKFSITIPAFKLQFLNEAIDSVIHQSYSDWELIIVDDCSPEDLLSVVQPFLKDSRIRYYRNNKNYGAINVVDNWNKCLSYCTGDYVICIGDDDRLLPCCLEEYRKLIEKYPALNVYHAWTEIIDEHGKLIDIQEPRPEWESALSLTWNRWTYRKKQFIGDFCYNLKYLNEVGGYYKLPLAWGSDDITAVQAAIGNGIANTQTFCFQYRDSTQTISQSKDNSFAKIEATLKNYLWFHSFLDNLSTHELSATDRNYFRTIDAPRQRYYQDLFGMHCIEHMRGIPKRAIKCYRFLKAVHYKKTLYLRWYLKSIYLILFK